MAEKAKVENYVLGVYLMYSIQQTHPHNLLVPISITPEFFELLQEAAEESKQTLPVTDQSVYAKILRKMVKTQAFRFTIESVKFKTTTLSEGYGVGCYKLNKITRKQFYDTKKELRETA